MNRYQALVEKFGDDQLLVLRGEKFGVVSLAKQILDRACRPFFRNDLSRRFLASTGINGAQFYKNGVFQPLTTVAIVEEFLESTEAERYEDGVRYFMTSNPRLSSKLIMNTFFQMGSNGAGPN